MRLGQVEARPSGNSDCFHCLARSHSVRDLKLLIKGIRLVDATKRVLLSLSPKDHKMLVEALLKHGATSSGNGLANKEVALMKIVAKLALYEEL